MAIRLIACIALALLTQNTYAQQDRPPYESYKIDELKEGERYEFGANFRDVQGGVEIIAITPNTTADFAKFKVGDILTWVGTKKSGLTAKNMNRVFQEEANGNSIGFVYIELKRDSKALAGIFPLSQAIRTEEGMVYELPDHGIMAVFLGQLNAIQNSVGDLFSDAPDDGSFRSSMRFSGEAFKKMASGYRMIRTAELPKTLADKLAEAIAAADYLAIILPDISENEFGKKTMENGFEDYSEKMFSLMSLVKTYDEYRRQEKQRHED